MQHDSAFDDTMTGQSGSRPATRGVRIAGTLTEFAGTSHERWCPPKMHAKKPATTTSEQRLTKLAAKSLVKARQERKAFVVKVMAAKSTPESTEKAGQLVRKVRDAKSAPFLGQYRRAPAR